MLHDQTGAESLRKKLQSSELKVLDLSREYGYHLQGTRCFSTAKGCFVRYQAPLFDICLLCCGRCNICRPLTFAGNTGSPLCYLLKVGFVLECFLKLPYESTTRMISSCWLWVHRFLKRRGVKGGVGSPKVFFHVCCWKSKDSEWPTLC